MTGFSEYDLQEMVVRLAHQIRNPLATIKSGIQLVQHLLQPSGEMEEYLEAALVEVERINRIVSDMQRMIRLDSATAQAVSVAEIVDEAVSRCAAAAAARDVTVIRPGGPAARVLADPSQMVEAMSELLGNAIEFSKAGSTVRIGWASEENRLLRVEVSDGCGGIPATEESRIFRPFYSTSTRGTGLGLNIVKRICELGGGRMEWANLADGSGCRFSIVMPEA